ncbi:AAA family ATPase [Lysinibacter cavernae]|uniref:Putative ATPase n=1 Tax=Lysinibacter cavernae TaxID=1640652 RepID=A0A7X5R0A4_9MICO|nr:AAA family ATPase [Lysinibacter cavernae]NIH53309.1 putative ATPase [Lysinibacter cavernae]
MFDTWPIRSIEALPEHKNDASGWPASLPPVRHLLKHGITLGQCTVLIGENGSGKSTIIEGIARAYGLSPEGGSTMARHSTRPTESALGDMIRLTRNGGASKRGYFLRAETTHGFFTYLEENPGGPEPAFHEMSHGESFLELVVDRFTGKGLWVLDEPESALSFSGCLALVGILSDLVRAGGSQVILSTHSPVLAALPGADILEVGEWGLRQTEWRDLDVVNNLASFLDEPQRYLRHL